MAAAGTPGTGHALDGRAGHQHLDLVMTDLQPQPEGKFGMDPASAVGAPGGVVHGPDLLGEPSMADCPRRRRPATPCVVARIGNRQQPAGHLDGQSFCGHSGYGRVPPCGSCGSRSSSCVSSSDLAPPVVSNFGPVEGAATCDSWAAGR